MGSSNVSSGVMAGQVDMISHLPDEIICRILSLIPTRYSIRTSVLSKRWKHLWVFAPKLDLEFDRWNSPMPEQYEHSFIRFVDLLFLRDNLCFHSLRLCINAKDEANIDVVRLNSWFFGVLKCNIHELDLEIWRCDSELPELPLMLFTCKTLVVLKICGLFVVNVPYYVWLPNLKTLVLDNVIYLGDESLPKLLSGCPILEDLHLLRDARGGSLSTCDVSHPTLKRLKFKLDDPYDDEVLECKIRVDAPNLELIDLEHRGLGDVLVNSLPSTAEVHVVFYQFSESQEEDIKHGNIVLGFLKSIANLKSLILRHDNLEFLAHFIGSNLPIFGNLDHLEIDGSAILTKLVIGFLENSPKLEVLSLKSEIESDEAEFHNVPQCLLHSLKSIEINYFCGAEDVLNAVKYLLENAVVLEKITIFCHYSSRDTEFFRLQRELANHPLGSTNCQFHFLPEW